MWLGRKKRDMKAKFSILIVLSVIAVLLFGILLRFLLFVPNNITRSVDMAYEVTDKTLTADNAIHNYEWFKKREGEIAALYKQEERAKLELEDFMELFPNQDSWKKSEREEYSRLRSNITAVGNVLDNAIEEYNARSGMANREIFKDNLPASLTRAYYAGKNLRDN